MRMRVYWIPGYTGGHPTRRMYGWLLTIEDNQARQLFFGIKMDGRRSMTRRQQGCLTRGV